MIHVKPTPIGGWSRNGGESSTDSGRSQAPSFAVRDSPAAFTGPMPRFALGKSVKDNVLNLRTALGSAVRPLSRDDLAEMICERHRGRKPAGSSVQRWEEGREPDYASARIMADLANSTLPDGEKITVEQFMFGDPNAPAAVVLSDVERARGESIRERRAAKVAVRRKQPKKRR